MSSKSLPITFSHTITEKARKHRHGHTSRRNRDKKKAQEQESATQRGDLNKKDIFTERERRRHRFSTRGPRGVGKRTTMGLPKTSSTVEDATNTFKSTETGLKNLPRASQPPETTVAFSRASSMHNGLLKNVQKPFYFLLPALHALPELDYAFNKQSHRKSPTN